MGLLSRGVGRRWRGATALQQAAAGGTGPPIQHTDLGLKQSFDSRMYYNW
jgi:hypothetical protein